MRGNSETAKERRDYILEAMKSNMGNPVNVASIAERFSVTTGCVQHDILTLAKEYPDNIIPFKSPKGGHERKCWVEPAKEERTVNTEMEVKPDRYPITKNSEGYNDPTFAQALLNTECDYAPGDILEFRTASGITEYYAVVSGNGYRVTVVPIFFKYDDVVESEKSQVRLVVTNSRHKYFFNPTRIYTKPVKYSNGKIDDISDRSTANMLGFINKYLKLSDVVEIPGSGEPEVIEKVVERKVEVPVEKVVEKIVEVPVEKIVEVPVENAAPNDDILDKLLAQIDEQSTKIEELEKQLDLFALKSSIYEDMVNRLLPVLPAVRGERI